MVESLESLEVVVCPLLSRQSGRHWFCIKKSSYNFPASFQRPLPSLGRACYRSKDLSTRGCSVSQSCLTLCNPVDRGTPGFPVLHYLLEFAQAHVHRPVNLTEVLFLLFMFMYYVCIMFMFMYFVLFTAVLSISLNVLTTVSGTWDSNR